MKFINIVKKIFKKSIQNESFTPSSITKKEKERIEAETRLTQYLAEEQERKKAINKKLFEELQIKKRNEEQIAADTRLTEIEKNARLYNVDNNHFEGNEAQELFDRISEKERFEELVAEQKHRTEIIAEEQRKKEELKLKEQKAEEKRLNDIIAEEQRKKEELKLIEQKSEKEKLDEIKAKERKIIEKERIKQIHALNRNDTFVEYLREAEKFRKEFGKNIRCDVCSKWDVDLHDHRGQTYCGEHIPPEFHRENERKIRAGRHDSVQDFIKK